MGLDRLDDHDYPVLTVGEAATLLGVQPAFLRSLDKAGLVRPLRSHGGHRRYSRRQLEHAAKVRSLFDQGHTLASAARVLSLEDDLETARDERDLAHQQRDEAREQRDRAYQQRDEAREQRDRAYQQRDKARQQRDEAYRELDEISDGRAAATRRSVAPPPEPTTLPPS